MDCVRQRQRGLAVIEEDGREEVMRMKVRVSVSASVEMRRGAGNKRGSIGGLLELGLGFVLS